MQAWIQTIGRPLGRRYGFAVLIALLFASPLVQAKDRATPRGRSLGDVLERYRADGVQLLYSSALVDPTARVTVEPSTADPLERLRQILRAHGLTLQEGPAEVWRVVRLELEVSGQVLSASQGAALAAVRVGGPGLDSLRTRADGRFRIPQVACGTELTFEHPGFETLVLTVPPPPANRTQLSNWRVRLTALPSFVAEVVVTPGRHAVRSLEPNARRGWTREETLLIPRIGGDVSRVIEMLPGVAAPDNSAAFNIRGSLVQDVSLLLDGVELYDPFHLRAFQSPFSAIDGDLVERIEVFGGGWTTDLGDRHGGFVQLSTESGEPQRRGNVQLGTLNSRLTLGGPIGATSSWLGSVRSWYPEALRSTIELGEDGVAPRFADGYFKVSHTINPKTLLTGHGLFAYDRFRFNEPDGNETVNARSRSAYLWLRLQRAESERLQSQTVVSAGRLLRNRDGTSEPEDDPLIVRDERRLDFFGLRHDTSWQFGEGHLLRGGVDVRRLSADYQYEANAPAGPTPSIRLDPTGTAYAAYVAHRLRIGPALSAEYGLRWARQDHTDDTQWSPRFNAVWAFDSRSTLRLGVGRFHQSQRIHELRVEDGETAFLPAERSRQVELSFERRLPRGLRLRVDAYDRKLSDLRPRYENFFNPLELFPETESDRTRLRPDAARLRGIEGSLRNDPQRALTWWVSYTRAQAEDRIDGRDVPRSWDQPDTFRFLLGYRREGRWGVSLSGSAHTGWPTTPATATLVSSPGEPDEAVAVLGLRNSDRFDDYARLDFKWSYWWTRLPRGRLRLDVEIVNLTDRRNICCVDEVSAAIDGDGAAQVVRELDAWLGFTPSAALTWEF